MVYNRIYYHYNRRLKQRTINQRGCGRKLSETIKWKKEISTHGISNNLAEPLEKVNKGYD